MIFLDCYQGASGDMLVGALLDIERDNSWFVERIRELPVLKADVTIRKDHISGMSGTKALFQSECSEKLDTRGSIFALLDRLDLDDGLKNRAGAVYSAIFDAEARVHGQSSEELHLHELAGPYTILEIISFLLLSRDRPMYCSTLMLGSGSKVTAHGEIPIPAPVTAMLLEGLPVRISESVHGKELVTPTAAALISSICRFDMPVMSITGSGYGLGAKSALRIFSFEQPDIPQRCYQVETNIDDMTAEDISELAEHLRAVSSDVYIIPAVMKKGRSGNLLTVLVTEDKLSEVRAMILEKSSTAGFRYWETRKVILPRDIVMFGSSFGECRMKIQRLQGDSVKVKPEFDDIKKLSKKTGKSVSFLRDNITREYLDE